VMSLLYASAGSFWDAASINSYQQWSHVFIVTPSTSCSPPHCSFLAGSTSTVLNTYYKHQKAGTKPSVLNRYKHQVRNLQLPLFYTFHIHLTLILVYRVEFFAFYLVLRCNQYLRSHHCNRYTKLLAFSLLSPSSMSTKTNQQQSYLI